MGLTRRGMVRRLRLLSSQAIAARVPHFPFRVPSLPDLTITRVAIPSFILSTPHSILILLSMQPHLFSNSLPRSNTCDRPTPDRIINDFAHVQENSYSGLCRQRWKHISYCRICRSWRARLDSHWHWQPHIYLIFRGPSTIDPNLYLRFSPNLFFCMSEGRDVERGNFTGMLVSRLVFCVDDSSPTYTVDGELRETLTIPTSPSQGERHTL
jgi:hypothetical protein